MGNRTEDQQQTPQGASGGKDGAFKRPGIDQGKKPEDQSKKPGDRLGAEQNETGDENQQSQ